MRRGVLLTKYFLKSSFEEMFGNSKMKAPVIFILMIIAVLGLSAPLAGMVGMAYPGLEKLGQEGAIITFMLFVSILISFFFGMYTILNIFYFSNDIEQILPLPFRSRDIVIAKFLTVMFDMLLYSGILLLPLITYGIMSHASFVYYIYMIIVMLVTPIFPMIIATAISILLMRFTNLSKHKDAFKMISGCLSLIIIIGFNMISQGSNNNDTSEMVDLILQGNNSIIDTISGIFFTNKFSTLALINDNNLKGLLNILLVIAISALLLYLLYIIGGKLYLKSVIGISESYSKRENILKTKDQSKLMKKSSPLKALAIKDIKFIFRTPQLFINCVAMSLYMPIIIGIAMFGKGDISPIQKALVEWNYSGIVLAVLFLVTALFISAGAAGITAVSREGKDIVIAKYIPVEYKIQLYAKIISSLCINGISLLIIVVSLIILKASPIIIVLGALVAASTIISITLFGMLMDYRAPKLSWEDEKDLMKKNYMPLIIMVAMMIIGLALLFLSLVVFRNGIAMFLIIMTINVVISIVLYNRLLVHAENVYNER